MKKLSDVVVELGRYAPRYVRLFRTAVAEGQVDALELAEKFKLTPKRDSQDFAIVINDSFKKWHSTAALKAQTRGDAPTFSEVKKGQVDIEEQIKATREKLKGTRERSARSNARRRKTDTE